jgi:E1A/CREB-binding protein
MNQQRLQANSLAAQQGGMIAAPSNSVTPGLTSSSVLSPCGLESSPTCDPPALEELDVQQPPAKRVKIEPPSDSNLSLPLSCGHPSGPSKLGAVTATPAQSVPHCQIAALKSEQSAVKIENSSTLGPSSAKVEQQVHAGLLVHRAYTAQRTEPSGQVRATESRSQPQNLAESHNGIVAVPACSTLKGDSGGIGTAIPTNPSAATSTKIGKPKNCGTSLTELFTPEQIREHITGLRQWVGQSKAKAEKNQAMEHQMSENACRLCAVEKLTFEPPPIYCTACGARIKRNASYYTTGSGDTRHYFCVPCYNEVRSENVEMEGMIYPKAKLERKKNDEETEEAWVQCDKCNLWQHQVCALFNGRRNEGDSEYICPECCCLEMERGERKSLPSSAVLGAKDLPKTFLSDHLEQRLTRKLKQERAERAKAQGKGTDEVPGAEALVVRVVSSVDKKLEVKQRFLEIFQEEDYPTEYPYRSKVVLLFQKIEGVEVCLFGMYVQEFGVESSLPNQRRVYLSYLDSVKYFRPDVRTANGEALRTFVYHEILIGYLDYCRRRGFSSCYIWACPPLKGEDYILYCHPEIQKTPKSDKLRDWYLTMLRKASSDGIVVEITNLYDHFFTSTGECKAKVTAARLPYFDGDYWPGAAEDMIVQLQQEEEDVRKNALKKGKTKKHPSKRFSKGLAQVELASNASKDSQLMLKLGESIFPMKEDFIMVHMHHACTHCRLFIVSGHRWVCKQCKNFQLCDKCNDVEQTLEERDRHPINVKEMHLLQPVDVNDIPCDTKDKDESMESEFFDTRQAFLSLCQGNHYQYDTLRRAKHSSMMVLYHLHNPTAPAFVVSCNICHLDIETGNGWRCETCADFDLCNKCKDTANHPHKLAPFHDRTAQNKEARQQRVLQLRKMLELLVHASQCGVGTCQYPKCRSVKGLFRHGMNCRIRASGGCNMCKRMWYLLQLHARACKESECRVPRCKDLKEHLRRLNQQMESRRRVAVKEMMRQRAAEAAGSNN